MRLRAVGDPHRPARYWLLAHAEAVVQATHDVKDCNWHTPVRYCPPGHDVRQLEHTRSVVVVPGVDSYCPLVHWV